MNSKKCLSFDIGGTKILASVINENLDILISKRIHTDPSIGPKAFIEKIISLGIELLRQEPCDVIGIASAGPLDPLGGQLLTPTNLKSADSKWKKIDIVQPLQTGLSLDCYLENDAAAAVLAEWKTQKNKSQSLACLTLGTGVGVGLIQNGQLFRNRNFFHPELSHIKINAFEENATCGCGQLGCIEAFLSGRHFPQYWAKKSNCDFLSSEELVEKARSEDTQALKAFKHYSELLALAIDSLVLIGSPEIIYFSGGFSDASDLFLDNTKKQLENLLCHRREGLDYLPQLKASELKETAGVIGAACVAFNGPNRF